MIKKYVCGIQYVGILVALGVHVPQVDNVGCMHYDNSLPALLHSTTGCAVAQAVIILQHKLHMMEVTVKNTTEMAHSKCLP